MARIKRYEKSTNAFPWRSHVVNRLNPAQLHASKTGFIELLKGCIVDTVVFDAAATISQQHLGVAVGLDGLAEDIDLPLAEAGNSRDIKIKFPLLIRCVFFEH